MTQPRDTSWLASADQRSPWEQVRVAVAGLGLSGFAAADALQHLGAAVTVVAESTDEASREKATLLEILGVDVRLGGDPRGDLPGDLDLVVMSPGIPPGAPLPAEAARRGLLVWGDVELAWRLRDPANLTPWLCVTGTNGKTTTVQMLEAMLRADGLRAAAAGNVGLPMCEVVMDPDPFDVLAVELSSHQLHWSSTLSAHSATVLNVAPDHLSWHGDVESYTAAKAKVYERCQVSAVYNVDASPSRRLVEEAEVVEGCRAIGFTLGIPSVGMIGLVEDVLADRAFIEGRDRNAAELARVADVSSGAPHNVANALAAAALARSFGVAADAVRRGLQGFELDRHRIAEVGDLDGVRYVDDSKATNSHAALASLQAFDTVVWVAGGLAKGASFDELVKESASRLRGVVLLGADRALISAALSRHAPDVPVIEVSDTETGVMERAVHAAASLAQPGDTVLLAPACASQDLFADYAARGDAFAAAVRWLRER
ncbi:MAG: UDP-N-acetylmuramoyl-L-alanine--D-glutamate ligase [Propionibacteriales bacterium]|nr:UDP-N-acetylmuramoyl-L-alanine--D-glutamate ligase [Propionibacteriales bacterium]